MASDRYRFTRVPIRLREEHITSASPVTFAGPWEGVEHSLQTLRALEKWNHLMNRLVGAALLAAATVLVFFQVH
jgi:hypothetical protein